MSNASKVFDLQKRIERDEREATRYERCELLRFERAFGWTKVDALTAAACLRNRVAVYRAQLKEMNDA